MTTLFFDLLTLATSALLLARTVPEWWLAVGDVAYQHRHGIR